MPFIARLYEAAKQMNILGGTIISDLIAFISYAIYPAGLIAFGDIQMILGVSIGTYFTLKHLKKHQAALNTSLMAALLGSLLSAISMIIYDLTAYFLILRVISFGTLMNEIFSFLLEVLIIGVAIGLIEGLYFKRKKPKFIRKDNIDEEFYESLRTK